MSVPSCPRHDRTGLTLLDPGGADLINSIGTRLDRHGVAWAADPDRRRGRGNYHSRCFKVAVDLGHEPSTVRPTVRQSIRPTVRTCWTETVVGRTDDLNRLRQQRSGR